MKLIKKWKATVKDGKLTIKDLKAWTDNLFHLNDKEVDIMIQLHSNKRTLAQNRLYWMWIGLISDHCGYDDPEDAHKAFGAKFLADRSKQLPFAKSTTKLDTLDFHEYMNKVERYANVELGIVLPHPEDLFHEYEEEVSKARGK